MLSHIVKYTTNIFYKCKSSGQSLCTLYNEVQCQSRIQLTWRHIYILYIHIHVGLDKTTKKKVLVCLLKAYCTNDLSKYFIKTIKWKHSPRAHYAKELRVPQKRASVSRKVQWFELVIQLIMNPLQLLYHYRFTKRTCRLCKAALGPSRSIIII